jgi:L-ribulose-5-phosphate 4-epimerase
MKNYNKKDVQELKQRVCKANLDLVAHGLVIFTWGNASAIDREKGLIVIKPSGVNYRTMSAEDMVVIDMDGVIIDGKYKPSSDTPTHLELYRSFPETGGIVHTHSTYATAWAQAGKAVPVIGTTHADYFSQNIPCTPDMTQESIFKEYEKETGLIIVDTFKDINPLHTPGVLVKNHGPFTWGKNVEKAVENSVVLEEISKIALLSFSINPELTMNSFLAKKHFERKHGKQAYYGQKKYKKDE